MRAAITGEEAACWKAPHENFTTEVVAFDGRISLASSPPKENGIEMHAEVRARFRSPW